jgi:hypothetical protein
MSDEENNWPTCEIWGAHSGEDDDVLLGFGAV